MTLDLGIFSSWHLATGGAKVYLLDFYILRVFM